MDFSCLWKTGCSFQGPLWSYYFSLLPPYHYALSKLNNFLLKLLSQVAIFATISHLLGLILLPFPSLIGSYKNLTHPWGPVQWSISTPLPLLYFQSTVWLLNLFSVYSSRKINEVHTSRSQVCLDEVFIPFTFSYFPKGEVAFHIVNGQQIFI